MRQAVFRGGRALTTLFLVLLTPVSALAADVTFLVTSDSHYDALEHEDRNERNRATLDEMNRISEVRWPELLGGDVIDRPRGVLVLGDVIDDGDRMRGSKNQSELQFRHFLADFGLDGTDARLKYPVFEGWGNHDGPPIGRERFGFSFQSHLKRRNKVRLRKGIVDHVSKNGLHYSWNWDDVHFIQLNLYPGNTPHPETRYSASYHDPQGSLDFLKTDLALRVDKSGRPVVIMHHYDLQGTDWWHNEERRAYYETIKPYNVIAVFHGHTGTGVYRWKPDGDEQALDVINTGQTENGFFVVQVSGDRMRLAHRAKMDVKTIKKPDGERREWGGTWGWRHTFTGKIEISQKKEPRRN